MSTPDPLSYTISPLSHSQILEVEKILGNQEKGQVMGTISLTPSPLIDDQRPNIIIVETNSDKGGEEKLSEG